MAVEAYIDGNKINDARPLAVEAQSGSAVRFVDENGIAYGVKHVNNKPRVSSMPYLYDIAEGHVTGHVAWAKLGYNGDVGTTEEDVWTLGGIYAWPPAGGLQMSVVSASANDAGGGSGVQTVRVLYLDPNYAEQSEIVTLNGVGVKTTVATNIFRVQGFRAVTCGANGVAAGAIRLYNGAVNYSQIALGFTRARNITYTVPAGKALYITSATFSNSSLKGVRFITKATYDHDADTLTDFFLPYTEVSMNSGAFYRPFELPTMFPAQVRIKVGVIADAAGGVASVGLRGWLEDA